MGELGKASGSFGKVKLRSIQLNHLSKLSFPCHIFLCFS